MMNVIGINLFKELQGVLRAFVAVSMNSRKVV